MTCLRMKQLVLKWKIPRVGQQVDIFGINPVQHLPNALIQEAQNNTSKSCSVIMTQGRTMLSEVNSDSSAMIIDSHSRGNEGVILAHSNQVISISLLSGWML